MWWTKWMNQDEGLSGLSVADRGRIDKNDASGSASEVTGCQRAKVGSRMPACWSWQWPQGRGDKVLPHIGYGMLQCC